MFVKSANWEGTNNTNITLVLEEAAGGDLMQNWSIRFRYADAYKQLSLALPSSSFSLSSSPLHLSLIRF
jgi:hypothetical protein